MHCAQMAEDIDFFRIWQYAWKPQTTSEHTTRKNGSVPIRRYPIRPNPNPNFAESGFGESGFGELGRHRKNGRIFGTVVRLIRFKLLAKFHTVKHVPAW